MENDALEGIAYATPVAGREIEYDISHLFCGHEVRPGGRLTITGKNSGPSRHVTYSIQEAAPADFPNLFSPEQEGATPRLLLGVQGQPKVGFALPLTTRGGLGRATIDDARRLRRRGNALMSGPEAQFVSSDSMSSDEMLSRWNELVLTEGEERVVTALRYLEPSIERIAATVSPRVYSLASKGGFKVKLKHVKQPVPIGSLGDGIWRMLALAVSLIRAKDGVLLVDEIDTGLHYTVMANMWKFLDAAARDFNVQVFATTHSYDCTHSLAVICADSGASKNHVTIQRIEQGKKKAVPFTESEISVAAKNHIEMR